MTTLIPTAAANPDGLHQRYCVTHADGSPTDPNAEYFVLRLDQGGKDQKHVAACRKGIRAYAHGIRDHIPKLAEDISQRYGEPRDAEEVSMLRQTIRTAHSYIRNYVNDAYPATHAARCLRNAIFSFDGADAVCGGGPQVSQRDTDVKQQLEENHVSSAELQGLVDFAVALNGKGTIEVTSDVLLKMARTCQLVRGSNV